jgi:hypothetical protein
MERQTGPQFRKPSQVIHHRIRGLVPVAKPHVCALGAGIDGALSGIWAALSLSSAGLMQILSTQIVRAPKRLRKLHKALYQLAVIPRRCP